jgi:hypothetical protein
MELGLSFLSSGYFHCGQFFDFSNNCRFQVFAKNYNQRTGWLWVFEKNQNQRTARSGYFKNLEELLGFMKEPLVLCWCFTGWSCGGSFTFWPPLVICIYNQSDLQQRTGLVSKNCPTLGYFLILDLLLYRQEILT